MYIFLGTSFRGKIIFNKSTGLRRLLGNSVSSSTRRRRERVGVDDVIIEPEWSHSGDDASISRKTEDKLGSDHGQQLARLFDTLSHAFLHFQRSES